MTPGAFDCVRQLPKFQMLKYSAGGHYMTGPIYVCGAEPGDVLEVRPWPFA